MSCDGELIRSCEVESCVMFCLVRAVYKFGPMPVVNRTHKKWQALEIDRGLTS